jgi:hypothetical protein
MKSSLEQADEIYLHKWPSDYTQKERTEIRQKKMLEDIAERQKVVAEEKAYAGSRLYRKVF